MMRKSKPRVPMVEQAAFVAPMWDVQEHRDVPSEGGCCVYYNVYGWDFRRQRWQLIDCTEIESDAKAVARKWHEKVMKRHGCYPLCALP